MINIILVEPRIPQNTGNIGRLALATNATLHIIHPIGFLINSKEIRRSGMDYFNKVNLYQWDNLESFWNKYPVSNNHFFFTTKTKQNYLKVSFPKECFLYFGREDKGLNKEILDKYESKLLTIPMFGQTRSLNLASCASIVVYEVIRQNIYKE